MDYSIYFLSFFWSENLIWELILLPLSIGSNGAVSPASRLAGSPINRFWHRVPVFVVEFLSRVGLTIIWNVKLKYKPVKRTLGWFWEKSSFVESGKITRVHPIEGVTTEVSFTSEIRGEGRYPSGIAWKEQGSWRWEDQRADHSNRIHEFTKINLDE
jgi:hypothetical protein